MTCSAAIAAPASSAGPSPYGWFASTSDGTVGIVRGQPTSCPFLQVPVHRQAIGLPPEGHALGVFAPAVPGRHLLDLWQAARDTRIRSGQSRSGSGESPDSGWRLQDRHSSPARLSARSPPLAAAPPPVPPVPWPRRWPRAPPGTGPADPTPQRPKRHLYAPPLALFSLASRRPPAPASPPLLHARPVPRPNLRHRRTARRACRRRDAQATPAPGPSAARWRRSRPACACVSARSAAARCTVAAEDALREGGCPVWIVLSMPPRHKQVWPCVFSSAIVRQLEERGGRVGRDAIANHCKTV
jgi:hypothetical protein